MNASTNATEQMALEPARPARGPDLLAMLIASLDTKRQERGDSANAPAPGRAGAGRGAQPCRGGFCM